ncbi:MAG: sucrose-specific PTS transporter subunit IIBC [Turicibacter sp.]|nr:sucrose-specific PTS transporter subunit IIBC [Turicibacter sp.]
MSNQLIAQKLVGALGGKENIESVAHCATRLRVIIRDENQVQKDEIENIDKVKGSFFNSGQFQVILGTGTVNKVYEEVIGLGVSSSTTSEQKSAATANSNVFARIVRTFGDVFVPIIPVLVATGLFMGVRGLLTQPQVLAWFGMAPADISDNFILFTQILTDTAFIFLPALITMSAFKIFGGTPMIGLVLGMMLVFPGLPNAWGVAGGDVEPIYFFNFIPVVGYQASVIPAFISGFIGAKLEQKVRKFIPDTLDLIVTPFITLLTMIVVALFVIGPIFRSVEGSIVQAIVALLAWPFGLGGALIGFFHQIIVVTGVHHVFNALEVGLLAEHGFNAFNPIIAAAMAAQGGAALAVGLKTKSPKLKALSFSSFTAVMLGITEPAIFGINLRYVRPFVLGLVGGAIGGFIASLLGLRATGMGITLVPGMLLYLDGQLLSYLLTMVVSIGSGFALTWLFGFSDKMLENK